MKSLHLVVLGCLGFASLTSATELSGPWTGVYAGLKPVSKATSASPQAVTASASRYLRSANLVQRVPKETILLARFLVELQIGLKQIKLPDGEILEGLGEPTQAMDLYSITYNSTDVTGRPTVLSGLAALPAADDGASVGDASGGIIAYMHATTAQRSNAPSDREMEVYGVVTAFGGENYVIAMPDYLGYGVNRQPHPYALGKLNAMAGQDMILAVRELMAAHGRTVGADLFVTGYSEGGGNALWLARALQESGDPTLQPTATAAMSGPYDMSSATAKSFVAKQPPLTITQNVMAKPLLMAFAGVSAAQLTFQPTSGLLKPAFAAQTRQLFPGAQADATVAARLLTSAMPLGYVTLSAEPPHPEKLLRPELIAAIRTGDTSFPAMALWAENDNTDWRPKTPVYLLGVIQDPLVTFAGSDYALPKPYLDEKGLPAPFAQGNAQNTIELMRAKKFGRLRVGWMGFNGMVSGNVGPQESMTHGDAFIPCAILAAKFFKAKSLADMPYLPDPK